MRKAMCHPDRKYWAKGLCTSCYNALWHKANREERLIKMRAYNKVYARNNRERIALHKRKRRQTDIQFHLTCNLRSRMRTAIRDGAKTGSAIADLGCSIAKFKLFIENQFDLGMSWDNYGEWHLDHVLPLASFDLTDRQQFLEAANWLNYQPLWADENRKKGGRV